MTHPHTLPEDWQPTPGDINYAKSKLLCEAQIMEEAEKFKRYFTVGPGSNKPWKLWSTGNGAWGTWIQNVTPWTAWQKEQRGHAEPKPEPWELRQPVEPVNPSRIVKPRLRRMPGPGKRYTPQERQAIIDRIEADEPKRPPVKLRDVRVPMPASERRKLVPDEEMEGER